MKQFIYLMGIALILNAMTVTAQSYAPIYIRKANNSKELRMRRQHRVAPLTSHRIQPAAAELYSDTETTTPSGYYKYDAWGNVTEEQYGSTHYMKTWDNSHGYPVQLNGYYYDDNSDGTTSEPYYYLRTTLNVDGVRTLLEEPYTRFVLDAVGRITSATFAKDATTSSVAMTWNGDGLIACEYNCKKTGVAVISDISLSDIRIVYQTKPFNAYDHEYTGLFKKSYDYGIWMSAKGESFGVPIEVRTEVSEDKKIITTEEIISEGTKVIYKSVTVFTDGNGSYHVTEEDGYDYKNELSVTYNQYGDMSAYEKKEENGSTMAISFRFEWEYENGKPLQVKTYMKDNDNEEILDCLEVFTAWYEGSSINSLDAGESRILGATLYTMDGTKVRTLTAEEVQSAGTISAPQRGIYLLVTQTDKGIETRKIVI